MTEEYSLSLIPSFDKRVTLDVYGDRYDIFRTPDRRWYWSVNGGSITKTSGNRAKGMIWGFGDRAQREQERFERQQLFQRLQEKRSRQRLRQQQLEEFSIGV